MHTFSQPEVKVTKEELYKRHKRIVFDMKPGDFQKEIEPFAKGKGADEITMMSHKRSLVYRILERDELTGLARRVQIPLLVIKDNAYEVDSGLGEGLELVNYIA